MAHIVEFRATVTGGTPEPETSPSGGAEIIIFPGVRRERHAEPSTEPACRRESKPQRDLLVLPD